ncbi:GRB10-interacting GYF protein 2 isoform X2 [Photinus pyralis]|uniref:GRB10-interacting GYF protein 2 isoform X2 n=1 Tax=Photinus pyralis TaxID=7054 RepID=UPI0012677FE2|nr:GRB10-interacting GYF protein 2 isoform X2 [Photinus pyralis]
MLIAYLCIQKSSMTDSMNFGPEWLRNLSEGSAGSGAVPVARCPLAEYRYGREEMLALHDKNLRPPISLTGFPSLYSEQVLPPLALIPQTDEDRGWQSRPVPPAGVIRGGRGGSLERGGRINRGRGSYQQYGRGGYDGSGGWNSTEQTEWSPRKDYNTRASSVDNWRRNRGAEDDDGWRNTNNTRGPLEKWGRSTSWRDGGEGGEERGPPERANRSSWQENARSVQRRPWENDDHLPEWAMENPSETGGTFDATGAFHGSDDEQRDHKHVNKREREVPLQKSVSQQNIVTKTHPSTLPSSQSAISLSKPPDDITIEEKLHDKEEEKHRIAKIDKRGMKEFDIEQHIKQIHKVEKTPPKNLDKHMDNVSHMNNTEAMNGITVPDLNNRVEEEFDRLQEDLVKKLVVDEETPKKVTIESYNMSGSANNIVPPPNLSQPLQDKWCYQDPQGDLQGPFLSSEMAEWFRAGYFTSTLLVKRQCDENFYRLGDLVAMCSGNPFQCNMRIPTLKHEIPAPAPDNDLLQYQLLQRQFAYRQAQASNLRTLNQSEPWSNLSSLQQRDLLNQQVLVQAQMGPDIQLYQQSQQPPTNPLMHMISQMQQGNKLSGPTMADKPPSVQPQLDPIQTLVQQMAGLQSLSNNLHVGPSPGLPTTIPNSVGISGSMPTSGHSTNLSNSGLLNNFQNLPSGPLPVPVGLSVSGGIPGSGSLLVSGAGLHNNNNSIPVSSGVLTSNTGMPGGDGITNSSGLPVSLQSGLPGGLTENTLPPRPNPLGAVDPLSSANENDPIKNLLRQLANKQQAPQLDTLWQQNQFTNSQSKSQWQKTESPLAMWDIPTPTVPMPIPNNGVPTEKPSGPTSEQLQKQEKERQKQLKESQEREQKKKREEEKQAKKEAEEKRKEEQRRLEAERKAVEEKRKKEEERIKKELEKAKKEAEEKRMRELEEKRRLKEQRKAEEEARKRFEEQKRQEEIEKAKREMKEKEEQLRRQAEQNRIENSNKASRSAPWSQANSTPELSLADIQKAEREKRAEQAALLQMQRAQQTLHEQQTVVEKQSLQFSWAKKLPESGKVKTLAEIQQEEQDRAAKQNAEARLAYQKDKESHSVMAPTVVMPWNSSNLSWASTAAQWSNPGGFWEEAPVQRSPNKPSTVSKSNSTSAVNVSKPVAKQTKGKTKKEEQHVMKLFSNGPATDEFTDWCTNALKKLNSTVDIPTFISFLRDIESALEVRDYCKEYLGEGPTTQQFASQFLEKRRMIKPKATTQKDDMSSPAPAITPSSQHNPDFQEVKGKGKKVKKSKMMKVDARILGFSVTAAPDRINVGDRDYVEN